MWDPVQRFKPGLDNEFELLWFDLGHSLRLVLQHCLHEGYLISDTLPKQWNKDMDQSIAPHVSMYNTIFVGGAIIWTVVSSILIYIQYSASSSVSPEQPNKDETSGGSSVKKKGVPSVEMKITFGKKTPSKSEWKLPFLLILVANLCYARRYWGSQRFPPREEKSCKQIRSITVHVTQASKCATSWLKRQLQLLSTCIYPQQKKEFFSIHLLGFLLSVAVNVFSTYFSHNCRIAAAILTREVSNLRSHFRQSFWSCEASPGSNATCQETRGRVYYAGKILNILGINCKDTEPDFCTIKCNIKHQKKSVDENYSNSCLWTVTEGHLVDNTRHLRFSEILFGSPAYFA